MRNSRFVVLLAPLAGAAVLAVAFLGAPRTEPLAVGVAQHAAPAARPAALFVPVDEAALQPDSGPRLQAGETPPADPGSGPSAKATSQAASLAELQEFRAYVSDTLSGLRAEEAAGKLRALEVQAARLDETMAELEARLALSAPQAGRLRTALLSRFDREVEYVRLWEKGADEEFLADLRASDGEAHVRELSAFLSPTQVETYLSIDDGGGVSGTRTP